MYNEKQKLTKLSGSSFTEKRSLHALIIKSFSKFPCVKSIQIRSFKYGLNAGKYRPEKTPYLDTFHAIFIKPFFKGRSSTFSEILYISQLVAFTKY